MQTLLEIKGIEKRYEKHTALSGVSFNIPENSIFGLLGPNGAGKTTLIRIINQIIAPDKGEILFNGRHLTPNDTQLIGYLPEERGLYKKMEIGDQMLYLAQLKGLSKQDATARAKAWFQKFEIESWWKKKVEELSKGMQQKVQFIASVIHQPKLLILDEPFSGFDPVNANIIKNEILELKKQGVTIIFSTHRMESVEELCDHLVLIHKANIVLEGSTKQIRKNHRTFMFEAIFEGKLNDLRSGEIISNSHYDDDKMRAIIHLNPTFKNADLIKELADKVELSEVREQFPSVNEIFIKTVQAD